MFLVGEKILLEKIKQFCVDAVGKQQISSQIVGGSTSRLALTKNLTLRNKPTDASRRDNAEINPELNLTEAHAALEQQLKKSFRKICQRKQEVQDQSDIIDKINGINITCEVDVSLDNTGNVIGKCIKASVLCPVCNNRLKLKQYKHGQQFRWCVANANRHFNSHFVDQNRDNNSSGTNKKKKSVEQNLSKMFKKITDKNATNEASAHTSQAELDSNSHLLQDEDEVNKEQRKFTRKLTDTDSDSNNTDHAPKKIKTHIAENSNISECNSDLDVDAENQSEIESDF